MPDDNKISDNLVKPEKVAGDLSGFEKESVIKKKPEQTQERAVSDVLIEKTGEQATKTEQLGESTKGIATIASLRKKREERQKKIEEVLAKDLGEIYTGLSPSEKQKFKIKGEETAMEINNLLDKAKFKVRKVVNLIKKWLSMIPGVNKFFLEQEAKIKTDEIVKLKKNKLFD